MKKTETREQMEKRIREEIKEEMKNPKPKNNFEGFLQATEKQFKEAKDLDIKVFLQNQEDNGQRKSFELINALREFLQVIAYKGKADASLLTTTYFTGKAASIIIPTLDFLRQSGLVTTLTLEQQNNCWKIQYQLDDNAIHNGIRRALNDKYGLNIPELEKTSVRNNESIIDFNHAVYDEAGFQTHYE